MVVSPLVVTIYIERAPPRRRQKSTPIIKKTGYPRKGNRHCKNGRVGFPVKDTYNFSGQNLAAGWTASLLRTTPNSLIHLDILC